MYKLMRIYLLDGNIVKLLLNVNVLFLHCFIYLNKINCYGTFLIIIPQRNHDSIGFKKIYSIMKINN